MQRSLQAEQRNEEEDEEYVVIKIMFKYTNDFSIILI